MIEAKIRLAGDSAVTVELGSEISPAINSQIRAFTIALNESKLPGIVEVVPTYCSLMVQYDPGVIGYNDLVKKLKSLLGQLDHIQIPPATYWRSLSSTAGRPVPTWNLWRSTTTRPRKK